MVALVIKMSFVGRSLLLSLGWTKGVMSTLTAISSQKHDIIDLEEVRQWSIFQTLKLIILDLHNVTDDVLKRKQRFQYPRKAARNRAILRIGVNKGRTADATEGLSISREFI